MNSSSGACWGSGRSLHRGQVQLSLLTASAQGVAFHDQVLARRTGGWDWRVVGVAKAMGDTIHDGEIVTINQGVDTIMIIG